MNDLDQVLASLRRGWLEGRLAHAYLIVGAPLGRAGLLARQLAAMLYCTASALRPCGVCSKCLQTAARAHPDLLWIEPQKKSRGILMEQVEAVQQLIARTSFEGGWKVVVLQNADRLNQQASNRLLKTLEEPPPDCLVLLVTDRPEALLPTIVSRCQKIILSSDRAEELTGADAELRELASAVLTDLGGASVLEVVRRARLLASGLKQARDQIKAEMEDGVQEDETEGSADSKAQKQAGEARLEGRYREARETCLRWMLFWQRDRLFQAAGVAEQNDLIFSEQAAGAALSYRLALNGINEIEDMRRKLAQNLPEQMVFEHGLLRLAGCGMNHGE